MPGVRVRGFISGLGLTFGHALERAFRGGLRLEALGAEHGQGLAVWLLRQDRAFVGRVVLGPRNTQQQSQNRAGLEGLDRANEG